MQKPSFSKYSNVQFTKTSLLVKTVKTTLIYNNLQQKYIPLTQRRYHNISKFFFNLSGFHDYTLAIVNHQRGVRIGIEGPQQQGLRALELSRDLHNSTTVDMESFVQSLVAGCYDGLLASAVPDF